MAARRHGTGSIIHPFRHLRERERLLGVFRDPREGAGVRVVFVPLKPKEGSTKRDTQFDANHPNIPAGNLGHMQQA